MKKTRSRYANLQGPALFITFLVCSMITFILCLIFLWIWQIPIDAEAESYSPFIYYGVKIITVTPVSLFIVIFASQVFGILIGTIRNKYHTYKAKKLLVHNNPYRYYKDLPNNYGIGVNSLLADSTIENEKDIVAVLLDLCAQNYLHLSKHSDHYVIYPRSFNQNTHAPLSNEQYIIDLIKQNQLKAIDYHHWYNLCVADGVQLGLYQDTPNLDFSSTNQPIAVHKHKRPKLNDIVTPKRFFIALVIVFIISIFIYYFNSGLDSFADIFLNPFSHFFGILITFVISVGVVAMFAPIIAIFLAPLYSIFTITGITYQLSKQKANATYKALLASHLTKTPKGTEELQKLEAFKAFLAQFNTFVDKDPEAVILWDRYLSYAQVFGLTKEIMRSGYSQLIDNAAFKIDDINKIFLDNLEISTTSS